MISIQNKKLIILNTKLKMSICLIIEKIMIKSYSTILRLIMLKKDLTLYCRIARKQRLVRSIEGIKKPIRNLLEVGCGAGFSAEYLKGNFINYVGVDYSQKLNQLCS